jgi:hypothetical protein
VTDIIGKVQGSESEIPKIADNFRMKESFFFKLKTVNTNGEEKYFCLADFFEGENPKKSCCLVSNPTPK